MWGIDVIPRGASNDLLHYIFGDETMHFYIISLGWCIQHWCSTLGCVSLRFKGLPEGYRWGFPYLKNSKNCTKNLNIFFTSRWPGAKSAPVHQLAKKLYLRLWDHFKDWKPPPWASKNGEFPDFRLSETHPRNPDLLSETVLNFPTPNDFTWPQWVKAGQNSSWASLWKR